MKVLIVDDEAPARRKLRMLLDREPEIELVGEAADGEEAVGAIRRSRPDLVLLDIQMPLRGGFEVIEKIGVKHMPLVVFVTAFDQHALRAFEVHALDYLTKPFAVERLRATLARARRRLAGRERELDADKLSRLMATLGGGDNYLKRLRVRSGPLREVLVPVEDIVVLRSRRNDVDVVTAKATYSRRATLSSLEARLDPELFARINRSEIVRLDAIRELQPWFHGWL